VSRDFGTIVYPGRIMDYVAIGLLGVAVLVLLLVLRKMSDLRADLGRLDALESLDVLKSLPESLRRLEERLESLRPSAEDPGPPVEVRVDVADNLHDAVRSAVRGLERDVKKMLRITGRSRAEMLRNRIERGLWDQGYSGVRITGGIPRTRKPRSRSRVTVEAEREGAQYRGVVILRGNEVEETKLTPLTRMFP
jgi:hypothetical protein